MAEQRRIRDLAERLDAHRKRQLALHDTLTITDMYNVLEALRANETLIHQTAWQQTDGAKTLARHFTGVRAPTVQRLTDALSALGPVG